MTTIRQPISQSAKRKTQMILKQYPIILHYFWLIYHYFYVHFHDFFKIYLKTYSAQNSFLDCVYRI
jgi:hypothetical protein